MACKDTFFLLLLTLNVPLQIGKCTPGGTCTPGWEPLFWTVNVIARSHCKISSDPAEFLTIQTFKH